MRKVLNISQPQMGKTTYTLRETEKYLDMVNLNMVFEYNLVVEDVLKKAKNFSYRADKIAKKQLDKYRSNLIDALEPNFPTMLVGIMDVYRAQYVEGFLLWCKQRNIPIRMVVDEYDIFAIGHEVRSAVARRDEWLKMAMDQELVSIIEFNSATNINGMISDFDWKEVNVIKPYEGYCDWSSVNFQTLEESHFTDLLNGTLTREMKRKLARAYQSNENVLMNLNSRIESHDILSKAIEGSYDTIKKINYASVDSIADIPESNCLIIGGQKFGRSVTIPNLTTLFYYRSSIPSAATLLQAAGRVLGNRSMDPTIITTPQMAKSIEQSWQLEQQIVDEQVLLLPHTERVKWLNDRVRNLDSVKLFTEKSNGYAENKSSKYQVVDDVSGFQKADHWHEIDMPIELWHSWEVRGSDSGDKMWKLCLAYHPYLEQIKGIEDKQDGAKRKRIAIKEYNDDQYSRYVTSKNNFRKYPIMYGIQRGKPGKGFLIVKDKDIEYGENTWHHNEYGEKVRLVHKFIHKNS